MTAYADHVLLKHMYLSLPSLGFKNKFNNAPPSSLAGGGHSISLFFSSSSFFIFSYYSTVYPLYLMEFVHIAAPFFRGVYASFPDIPPNFRGVTILIPHLLIRFQYPFLTISTAIRFAPSTC